VAEAGLHGSNTLPKSERLQHGRQFRRAYEQGRKFVGRLFVLYVVDGPPEPPRSGTRATRALGVVTSRKVGNAVTRNRARRLLREAYRRNKQKLRTNLQMVMIARIAINGKRLQDVEAESLRLFRAAGILNET
jgi:ribonuclease P protein component